MEKVSLSNKVFSENPLLDEIVYNARQIATGVIVKDSDLADKCETKESLINGDILVAIGNNTIAFSNFYYDEDTLGKFYPEAQAKAYAKDNDLIPKRDRDALLKMAIEIFNETYEEKNNYYRMLHGQPAYDETGVWKGLWIDTKYIDPMRPTNISHVSPYYKEDLMKMLDQLQRSTGAVSMLCPYFDIQRYERVRPYIHDVEIKLEKA